MNINLKQILGGGVVVLSVLMVSSANLQDLFGIDIAKKIVSAAAVLNGISGGWLTILTSQTATVKDTLSMPGVEKITVNKEANSTLASIAVDPKLDNIAPKSGQEAQLTNIAEGNNK